SVLSAQCSVLSAQCSVLSAQCSVLMGGAPKPTRLTVLASLLGAFSEFSASDPVSCITGWLTFVIIQALVHNEGRAI
ncbi:hypothetical protein LCGC14_2558850, partial [marine sediment metagenome]